MKWIRLPPGHGRVVYVDFPSISCNIYRSCLDPFSDPACLSFFGSKKALNFEGRQPAQGVAAATSPGTMTAVMEESVGFECGRLTEYWEGFSRLGMGHQRHQKGSK